MADFANETNAERIRKMTDEEVPLRFGFYADSVEPKSFIAEERRITQMRFKYFVLNETSLGGAPEHYGWEEDE